MPIYKVAELIGARLDAAVALAEGYTYLDGDHIAWGKNDRIMSMQLVSQYLPSLRWSLGGPLIDKYQMMLDPPWMAFGSVLPWAIPNFEARRGDWGAWMRDPRIGGRGPTALIAAMRCLVACKYGETIDMPEAS